ncbi:hypothetical protein pdam_00025472, partial [Pocillopora damicornis]
IILFNRSVTRNCELSSVTYDIYIQQEQEKNSKNVSNKVKKVNLAEPGPSCTVPQNGETSGLCNGEVEEAKRQWKGLVHFLSIVTQIAPLPVPCMLQWLHIVKDLSDLTQS